MFLLGSRPVRAVAYPGLQVFHQPYVYFPTERVGPKSVLEAQWPEPTGLEFHIIHNDSGNTYNSLKTQTQMLNEKVACNTTLSLITIKKSSCQCIWSALQGNQISWNNILYNPCHCPFIKDTKNKKVPNAVRATTTTTTRTTRRRTRTRQSETRNKSNNKMTTIVVNTNHDNTLVLDRLCSASRSPQCCALRQKPTCCFVQRRCPCWASHCPRWQSCEPANN